MILWPLLSCLAAVAAVRQLRINELSKRNEAAARNLNQSPNGDPRTMFVEGWVNDGSYDPEQQYDPMTAMSTQQSMAQARQMYGPYGHRFHKGSLLEQRGRLATQPMQPPPPGSGGTWQQRDNTINVYAMTMPPNIALAVAQQMGFKSGSVSVKAVAPQMPSPQNMPFATGLAQQPYASSTAGMFGQPAAMSASDAEYWNRYIPAGYTHGQDPAAQEMALYGIHQEQATPFPVMAAENEEKQMESIENMADPTLAPTEEVARAEEAPDPAPLPRAEDALARMPVHQAVQKAAPPPGHRGDAIRMDTSAGQLVILLRDDAAPRTCAMLRQMVQHGLYDGCVFYRAEPGFVIQGGLRDSAGNTRQNPYGHFPFEYKLQNKRGTVTMARYTDPNSATGEFFINLNNNRNLDRSGGPGYGQGFEVWGEVLSGMDVAEKIAGQPSRMTRGGMHMLNQPVVIQKATIVKV